MKHLKTSSKSQLREVLLVVIFLLTVMVNLTAQTTGLSLTEEELSWLEEHPVIRISNEMDRTPFNFNKNDIPQGFSIDFITLLAETIGFEIDFISGPSWNDFMELIQNKDLDIILNIAFSEERAKFIKFTDPYFEFAPGLFTRDDYPTINSVEDLYSKKFAVPKGFFFESYFTDHPQVELVRVLDTKEAILAVSNGSADAMLDLMPVVNYFLSQLLITNLKTGGTLGLDEGKPIAAHFGIRDDWEILRDIIDKGMEALPEDKLHRLRVKWLGYSESADEKGSSDFEALSLTEEEKSWLKTHKTIRFAGDPDYAPFEFFSDSGEYMGIVADYLKLIESRLDITFELVPDLTWPQAVEAIKTGSIDLLPDITNTEVRRKNIIFTRDYLNFPQVIVTQNDYPSVDSIDHFNGKIFAVTKGYSEVEEIGRLYPDVQLNIVDSSLDELVAVATGQADGAQGNLAVLSYLISKNNLLNLRFTSLSDVGGDGMAMGIRQDWDLFPQILNKVLASISHKEINHIHDKWISVLEKEKTLMDEEVNTSFFNNIMIQLIIVMIIIILFIIGVRLLLKQTNNKSTVFNTKQMMNVGMIIMAFFIAVVIILAWMALARVKTSVKSQIKSSLEISLITTEEGLGLYTHDNLKHLSYDAKEKSFVELVEKLLVDSQNGIDLVNNISIEGIQKRLESLIAKTGSQGYSIISPNYITIAISGVKDAENIDAIAKERIPQFDKVL